MRIYLSCQQSLRRHDVPAYAFWERYFKRGIEEAGHEWLECPGVDWAEGLATARGAETDAWRARTWERVCADIRARHLDHGVDLFLAYLYPHQVDATAVNIIREMGIPCVNFFCDNVREFRAVPDEYRVFDLHWVPELAALPMYDRAGLLAIHRPMPVWVDPLHRVHDHDEEFPATFIGSRDVVRERLMADALEKGARLELRGPGWRTGSAPSVTGRSFTVAERIANQVELLRHDGPAALMWKLTYRFRPRVADSLLVSCARPPVFGDDYVRVTQRSRVTLGVNRYPSYRHPIFNPDTYSRLRDVEAPMMGACYLTEWTPELERMYDLGREIETYRTADELVEGLRRLERDRWHRRRLRREGQRRALTDHTVPRTIQAIGEAIGVAA